jgi:uncharacterized protein YegJ (DUF2314 family)
MVMRRGSLIPLLLSIACADSPPKSGGLETTGGVEKTTISVAADDREMNAAMQEARNKVSAFIARLQKPQAGDRNFSVKVPLRDGDQVEHFWLVDVRHDKGLFSGTLGNDPELIKGHKFGEPVSFAATAISDWMFVDRDHLEGGFTIRILRNRMGAAERAEFDKSLDFRIE